jgi:hypothetical protein
VPSIWHVDWPNWIRAMSLTAGSWVQPEVSWMARTSTGAPQEGQLVPGFWLDMPHQGQL